MEERIILTVLVGILILGVLTFGITASASSTPLLDDQITSFEENLQVDTNKLDALGIPFIENVGQTDSQVKFYANIFAGTVFVTEDGLTYALMNGASEEDESAQGVAVKEMFLSEQALRATGFEKSDAVVNYFVGEKERWRSNIPTYIAVNLGEVWPGVDVELRTHGKNVEKIFNVKPGANVGDIKLAFEGVGSLKVSEEGELLLETELGTLAMTKPFAFQSIDGVQSRVDVSYFVQGNTYGFEVGSYDPRYTLIIDPLLASTFIGGGSSDRGLAMALDSSGNVFVAGFTASGFPTTSGAFDETNNGGSTDVFVSKFNSDLTTLLASTFIGGGNVDLAVDMVLDSSGNVYIAGQAGSGYPTTSGAFDETFNGGSFDTFVSKLNNDLTSLLASTFIGGSSSSDEAFAMALDSSGNVYIAGQAASGFPTTSGAFDETNNGGDDAFVAKFNSDLTSLLASTFIGGSGFDIAIGMTLGSSGDVFVAGIGSSGYPTTSGAFDETNNGSTDAFVSKLNSDLTTLLASTFIGGSGADFAHSVVLDSSGDMFVAGTAASGYPTTSGAFDETHNGSTDAFVSKLNSDLTTLLASTFIGGSGVDFAKGLALDSSGDLFVAGGAASGFPTTSGAFDETHNGSRDVFISKLNSDLTTLLASTFIGGSGAEEVTPLVLDSSGDVFVAGEAANGYPTTSGAFDETFNGGSLDPFVTHITNDLALVTPDADVFEKTLVEDSDKSDPECTTGMLIGALTTTMCTFSIQYIGDSLLIVDTVPAEWKFVSQDPVDTCDVGPAGKGNPSKSATIIDCGETDSLSVEFKFETRQSPGKNNVKFAPTSCDKELKLNEAALALDPTTLEVILTSNMIGTPTVDDPNDTDCDQVENDKDNCPLVANRDQIDMDNDGAGAACDIDDDVPLGLVATGGTITDVDGKRIHTFTSSGTFEIISGSANVEYLVVAGGGGGGGHGDTSTGGGGGGAGGYLSGSKSVGTGNYIVIAGAGGSAGLAQAGGDAGGDGGDSIFDDITAIGGGGGAAYTSANDGRPGGSGGGGATKAVNDIGFGGTGIMGQGNDGGDGYTVEIASTGAGGGGAGTAGTNGSVNGNGAGGNGLSNSITGSTVTYAGGGGGGQGFGGGSAGTGGSGGGGQGGFVSVRGSDGSGFDGAPNTGGGGGGAGGNDGLPHTSGGAGGSGIVIVSYDIQ